MDPETGDLGPGDVAAKLGIGFLGDARQPGTKAAVAKIQLSYTKGMQVLPMQAHCV